MAILTFYVHCKLLYIVYTTLLVFVLFAVPGAVKETGYWSVVNFQLSDDRFEQLGWITPVAGAKPIDKVSQLQLAVERLQRSIAAK